MITESILNLIGKTPVMRLSRMTVEGMGEIIAKLEYLNPGGSIKSRTALAMIEDAERKGLIGDNSVIVEPSTGNQGVGLAMVGAVKGYKVVIIMPQSVSVERRKIIEHFGGKVILVKDEENIQLTVKKCLNKALEMQADDKNVFLTKQFENPANPDTHYTYTAAEILSQLDGKIDALCIGFGTAGSLMGLGKRLKVEYPECVIAAVEPENAPTLRGGEFRQHLQQGIGDGVISPYLDISIIDEVICVSDEDAVKTARELAKKQGLLVGISSGSNVFGSLIMANKLGKGRRILTILPDTAERYYSTPLFE